MGLVYSQTLGYVSIKKGRHNNNNNTSYVSTAEYYMSSVLNMCIFSSLHFNTFYMYFLSFSKSQINFCLFTVFVNRIFVEVKIIKKGGKP